MPIEPRLSTVRQTARSLGLLHLLCELYAVVRGEALYAVVRRSLAIPYVYAHTQLHIIITYTTHQ